LRGAIRPREGEGGGGREGRREREREREVRYLGRAIGVEEREEEGFTQFAAAQAHSRGAHDFLAGLRRICICCILICCHVQLDFKRARAVEEWQRNIVCMDLKSCVKRDALAWR
jgi:hypothetical protein